MSAFNVGKKVSAAIRILQRNRDASARATHLVVKKDPLITYEKALLGQATGGKFPSVTFLERKKMSTKTTIKRIALVAAVALTLGGFSAVSANAAIAGASTTFAAVDTSSAASTTPIAAGTAFTASLNVSSNAGTAGDAGVATFTVTAGPGNKDITSTCTFTAAAVTAPLATNAVSVASTGTFAFTVDGSGVLNTKVIGTVSCPTTIGGAYVITPSGTLATFTPTTMTTATGYVSGGNVSVGTTRSTTTGAAVGGSATVLFTLLTHTTNSRFPIASWIWRR